ncbi:hypothetical protein G6011_07038 [Alternaria panax]|uniref:Uncharacterized protein n=1 Tax=Alternaria panax TaxID=48097 RepID=A0AAD4F8Z3_9PLEO|nr:hypothetical protein G6011_07038 [Alternaria panax]
MFRPSYDSARDIPRTLERPWTPPEIEDESSPRPDYFNIYGTSPPRYPTATEQRWLKEANRVPDQPSWVTVSFGVHTPTTGPRPKPNSRLTEPAPYTPTRPHYDDESHSLSKGEPRYPYTPDSSRILRRNHTERPGSPTPWHDDSEGTSSPVQNALSSCIAHFENLIQTHQPDEEQLEYIVGQFEAMTAHLSTPSAHTETKDTTRDDTVLSESELDQGLGITQAEGKKDDLHKAQTLHHEAYVSQVGNYIAGVQKYIYDLKTRMDEVKTLNRIQLDVINDLRQQMRVVRQSMREELEKIHHQDDNLGKSIFSDFEVGNEAPQEDEREEKDHDTKKESMLDSCMTLVEEDEDLSREIHEEYSKLLRSTVDTLVADDLPPSPKRKVIHIIRSPPKRSFWASMGEALDAVSNMLLEDGS